MKSARSHFLILGLTLAMWLSVLLVGGGVAHYIGNHFGQAILHATRGKVTDAAYFVKMRLHDGALLVTMAVLLGYLHFLITRLYLKPSTSQYLRWPFHAVWLFVSVNVWLVIAMQTGLFWCAFYRGTETGIDNFTLFRLKFCLLRESKTPLKAMIVGNSQANRQIDEGLLNEIFGRNLYAGELHWPGSHGYDHLLVQRRTSPDMAQIVICYVSECNFYAGANGESLPQFFRFQDLPDLWKLNLLRYLPLRKVFYGLLGNTLPVFEMRDSISSRILGAGLTGIRQREVFKKSTNNLELAAEKVAKNMAIDDISDFQKKSFEFFVQQCAQRNQKLVIIAGQLNPLLGRLLPPQMRQDMLGFLKDLRARYRNVILIENPPYQKIHEYEDLTHVREEGETAFTRYLAKQLVDLKLVAPSPQNEGNANIPPMTSVPAPKINPSLK